MAPIGIAYVNLFVADLERAVAFYQTKLGLAAKFVDTDHGYASFDALPYLDQVAAAHGG